MLNSCSKLGESYMEQPATTVGNVGQSLNTNTASTTALKSALSNPKTNSALKTSGKKVSKPTKKVLDERVKVVLEIIRDLK